MSLLDLPVTYLIKQCARPTGFAGRVLARIMNKGHEGLTLWGLEQLAIKKYFVALDIGCGGGATIQRLAALAGSGKVYGIDLSPDSVAMARKTNMSLLREDRADITQASVSALPFPDDTFDVVTAVETHYFWPDLPANVKEVLRVLKPNGTFAVIAEVYKGSPHEARDRIWLKSSSMAYLGREDFERLFEESGFVPVQIVVEESKGYICSMGTKPSRSSGVRNRYAPENGSYAPF